MAAYFVLMTRTGGAWRLTIGATTALVAAHVLGTVLGTRLRDSSAEIRRWQNMRSGTDDAPVIGDPALARNQLPSRLGLLASSPSRPSCARRWAIPVGFGLGTIVSAVAIALTLGKEVTWPGVMAGAVSCGVVGAWTTFLATSFWSIGRQAWAESLRDS